MARGRRRVAQRVDITWYGDQFLEIVEKYGDEALFAAGEILLDAASSRAPRKSGRLSRSGYVGTTTKSTYRKHYGWRNEAKVKPGWAVVAFIAPHAHLQESGRRRAGPFRPRTKGGKRALRIGENGQLRAGSRYRRMAAHPFLGPAINATQTKMVHELAAVLNRRLEAELPT